MNGIKRRLDRLEATMNADCIPPELEAGYHEGLRLMAGDLAAGETRAGNIAAAGALQADMLHRFGNRYSELCQAGHLALVAGDDLGKPA